MAEALSSCWCFSTKFCQALPPAVPEAMTMFDLHSPPNSRLSFFYMTIDETFELSQTLYNSITLCYAPPIASWLDAKSFLPPRLLSQRCAFEECFSTDAMLKTTATDGNRSSRHSDTLIYSALFRKKFAKVFGLDSKAHKCIQTCLEAESPQVNTYYIQWPSIFIIELLAQRWCPCSHVFPICSCGIRVSSGQTGKL